MDHRFWNRINKTKGCWYWLGAKNIPNGYGVFTFNYKKIYAHRYSYIFHNNINSIPKGMDVCHTCDIKFCVNPNHLFLGTRKDNVRDMDNKGRRRSATGEDAGTAKMTWEKVRELRESYNHDPKPLRYYAEVYGIHHTTVMDILKSNNWNEK